MSKKERKKGRKEGIESTSFIPNGLSGINCGIRFFATLRSILPNWSIQYGVIRLLGTCKCDKLRLLVSLLLVGCKKSKVISDKIGSLLDAPRDNCR